MMCSGLFCLTWGEEGQCADGLIGHDVVEAPQLSKHLQAGLFLSSGIRGQAFPVPSIPLQLQNLDFTQVLQGNKHSAEKLSKSQQNIFKNNKVINNDATIETVLERDMQ